MRNSFELACVYDLGLLWFSIQYLGGKTEEKAEIIVTIIEKQPENIVWSP